MYNDERIVLYIAIDAQQSVSNYTYIGYLTSICYGQCLLPNENNATPKPVMAQAVANS